MKHILVAPNDPVLTKIAQILPPNELNTDKTRFSIEAMLDIAYGNRLDRTKPTVVGLAAPQIGISKRIIAVDVAADGKGGLSNLKIYLNPEIVWKSDETSEWYEGCWSTDRVCGIVSRSNKVTIKAITRDGKAIEETHEGYVARIFQHEIDHLDGKTFISHITDNSKLHWVEKDEFATYRNNEGWRNWKKKCSRKKWEQIRSL